MERVPSRSPSGGRADDKFDEYMDGRVPMGGLAEGKLDGLMD